MASEGMNPYEAPKIVDRAVGVKSGRREDLRAVAVAQKVILVSILIQIVCVIAQFLVPQELKLVVFGLSMISSLVATVFVFLLAIRVYSVGLGIFFGILTLIPCLGLIILLIINAKATGVLQSNGIKVGLMGANLAQLPPTG